MRVVAGLAGFFLICGISASAQNTPQPTTTTPDGFFCAQTVPLVDLKHPEKHGKGSTLTNCTVVLPPACPIDMRVRQRMGGVTVAVDANGVRRTVFVQRLRLFLNDLRPDRKDQKIVSATVTVHGTNGKAKPRPIDSSLDENAMQSTFTVNLGNWGEPGVSGDFGLPGFTSASRVDLDSVTYDDGSTWKLWGNETCRVAPDPLMLINH